MAELPPAPLAVVEAMVEVPASVLLPHIPEAVLLASPAELSASSQAQAPFRLPLGTILPMLPSGKIEVTVGDLASWAPEGIMHPPEVLGEWASQIASLPLPQIVMRISPEMMTLRRDQKQIDTMVLSMDDPFSPEALKAKAEAARAAAEAAAAQAAPPPPPEPEPEPAAPPPPEPEPEPQAALPEPPLEIPVPPAEPEPVGFTPEMAATTYIPEPPAVLAEEAKSEALPHEPLPLPAEPVPASEPNAPAPDFSFTQSPEYLALLAKLNQAEEAPEEAPEEEVPTWPASAEPGEASPEPQASEPLEPATPSAASSFAKPAFQFAPAPPEAEEVEEAEAAPEPMRSPLAAAVEATPPGLGSVFSKALGDMGKKSEAAAPSPAVPAVPSDSTPRAEDMRALLKLGPGAPAEIKDVVHHIGLWPGVDACIICGLDGLPIASFAPPGRTLPQVSAVAPKLLKTLATLFTDLGRREPGELAVPSGDETLHFFRHHGMILILASGEASIPPVYRRTIHEVLALLSHATPKS